MNENMPVKEEQVRKEADEVAIQRGDDMLPEDERPAGVVGRYDEDGNHAAQDSDQNENLEE